MTQMRLMEKLRAHKFTDFSYTWDTTYTGILVRSSDGDFPANIRTTASQSFTNNSETPTVDETSFTFILPRRYEYTTVFDGIARGNIKIRSGVDPDSTNCTTMSYFIHAHIYLKSITAAGVVTTISSVTTNTITHTVSGGSTGWQYLTVDIPFWMDCDNAILPNDERLILNIVIHAGAFTHSGHVSGTHAGTGDFYHTVNTDECFIELPIIP